MAGGHHLGKMLTRNDRVTSAETGNGKHEELFLLALSASCAGRSCQPSIALASMQYHIRVVATNCDRQAGRNQDVSGGEGAPQAAAKCATCFFAKKNFVPSITTKTTSLRSNCLVNSQLLPGPFTSYLT
jgi:hypothetical protein